MWPQPLPPQGGWEEDRREEVWGFPDVQGLPAALHRKRPGFGPTDLALDLTRAAFLEEEERSRIFLGATGGPQCGQAGKGPEGPARRLRSAARNDRLEGGRAALGRGSRGSQEGR